MFNTGATDLMKKTAEFVDPAIIMQQIEPAVDSDIRTFKRNCFLNPTSWLTDSHRRSIDMWFDKDICHPDILSCWHGYSLGDCIVSH